MTRSKPLEKTVVAKIMKALDNNYPGFYFKVHGGPYQMAGIPDIVGLHKGRFIAIEVKVPGREKNLSEKQKRVIKMIQRAGGISFMATSAEQVLETLEAEFRDDKTIPTPRRRIKKSSRK